MSVPTDKGANAGRKVVSLVAGMVAGADSIDDLSMLRHGGMGRLFARIYAPVIVAQRLRKGPCASARGAKRLVADAVKTARQLLPPNTSVLVRVDSAFCGRHAVHAVLAGGAQVSVTTFMDSRVKAATASIGEDAWTAIEYTVAVFDDTSGQWISCAEVAEIASTAFAAQPKVDQVPRRLILRRIPDFDAAKH